MRKIIITTAFLLAFGFPVSGQLKVIDKSSKKVPVWVNSSQTDYIVTSAIAGDLESVKAECLENVRKQVIRSVAENVQLSSSSTISQETVNSGITEFLDSYSSVYETQAAPVPFLKGITASKVEDYYWEKRRDKKTKQESYLYAIKYPFPSLELKKLVREFETRDKEMYDKYLELAANLDKVTSVEQIDRAITDLGPLVAYFFDDIRRNQASTLQANYRKLYNMITFIPVSNEPGEYRFSLMLEGREITTSQRPTLSSDTAMKLQANQDGNSYLVKYDYSGAAYDDQNEVSVRFLFGGRPVIHKFYFTIKKYKVEIFPEKTAYFTAEVKGDDFLTDMDIRINLVSKYREFKVKNITMNVPGLTDPIFLDNLDITLTGANPTLQVFYTKEAPMRQRLEGRMNILNGNMDVYIPETGSTEKIYFSLTFKPNW